ncbi:2'-5' RNA ligase family protein, partial [Pseudonocardia spinosispora]|uniref:2'-5' RNA ligase family protein n=1 Tax=Pseudonocardia spinosispora TaxID=103441 RepID=UPI0004148F96
MRLFVAIWPPASAVDALTAELDAAGWPPERWRATSTNRWHLTVRFIGDGDPGVTARELESRASGLRAPRLRFAGVVTFPGVLAAGVAGATEADDAALSALVVAAGGDPAGHRPHVTVARGPQQNDTYPPAEALRAHQGPWWVPADVRLVRSELTSGAPRYTALHRVPLIADPEPDPPA